MGKFGGGTPFPVQTNILKWGKKTRLLQVDEPPQLNYISACHEQFRLYFTKISLLLVNETLL